MPHTSGETGARLLNRIHDFTLMSVLTDAALAVISLRALRFVSVGFVQGFFFGVGFINHPLPVGDWPYVGDTKVPAVMSRRVLRFVSVGFV